MAWMREWLRTNENSSRDFRTKNLLRDHNLRDPQGYKM
jgi:hypothetical protein